MASPNVSNTDIPSLSDLTSAELQKLAPKDLNKPEETSHAIRHSRRSVLPEAKGVEGEGQRGGDMSEVNGTSPGNGETSKGGRKKGQRNKEKTARGNYHLAAVNFHKTDRGIDRRVNALFTKSVLTRMRLYQRDALDALWDLATMPLSECSDKDKAWKFEAARFLATGIEAGGKKPTSEFEDVLKQLNKGYRENAPRIKALRERTIEFADPEQLPAP